MPVHNAEIATMFDQTADLIEIQGGNPFRVRAYRRAARVIETLPQSVTSLMQAGQDLSKLSGIGKDLAGKIAEIAEAGRFELLESLKRELPGELGTIATLPGLGPKRVKLLYDKIGVCTIQDLQRAAETGRIRTLRGFGPKVEQKILAAVAKPVAAEKRLKLSAVEAEAETLLREGLDGQIAVASSYRRRRDTVADLDILITTSGRRATERRSCISPAPRLTTRLANERKWKLSEYGLFAGRRRIAGATEEEVYHKLGNGSKAVTAIPAKPRAAL